MATIIDLENGRFIAGDAAESLAEGEHWCWSCGGDGLEYDYDGELNVCYSCYGSGTETCSDTACLEHSTLHASGH